MKLLNSTKMTKSLKCTAQSALKIEMVLNLYNELFPSLNSVLFGRWELGQCVTSYTRVDPPHRKLE